MDGKNIFNLLPSKFLPAREKRAADISHFPPDGSNVNIYFFSSASSSSMPTPSSHLASDG
jgi:hypothetical protein